MVRETLPTVMLLNQGDGWYAADYAAFNEVGAYRVVVYAEDNEDLGARPSALEVVVEPAGPLYERVYLPLVVR